MAHLLRPEGNLDHVIDRGTPGDIDTYTVIVGSKSAKQLIQEALENPLKVWRNPGGQQLPDEALKGLANNLKAHWKLDTLTLQGVSAD